ncbi:unnamed protein product [Caenorhabditis sp. 36 PRJEB53466]|nr:unnamed protein product [Caenorhabditis sp. 36 PRJEB53466]
MKQKVKEKTGRSKATTLPEDVEGSISFFKALQPRVKDLHKHMNDLNDVFKWHKKANFLSPLANLGRLGDKVDVKPFEEAVNARQAAEADSQKGLGNEIDKFKAYFQNDCKLQQECIAAVNRTRLDMDSANSTYVGNETEANKMRADAATKEFEAACARVRELINGIKDLEANHSAWMDSIIKEMKVAFRK